MTNKQIIETLKEIIKREENLSFQTIKDVSHIIDAINEKEVAKNLMIKTIKNLCEEL